MSFSAHCLFAVLLTIFSLPTSLSAQSAPKGTVKTPRGSISGQVTLNDKGAFGVTVSLRKYESTNANERIPRAMTDHDGFYRITNVVPGTYAVSPSAPAFVPAETRESRQKIVLIGEDENVENINFTLVRGGVITGRVTDADGRPVIQQQVYVYRADAFERRGHPPPQYIFATASAQTDDRGIYRVFGLMPGSYKVAAGRSENVFINAILTGGTSYTQVFHPDATEHTKATVIELGEEAEATNIDISLGKALPTFTVTGRTVDGEKGLAVPAVRLLFQRWVGERAESGHVTSVSNAKGEFVATGLIPGQYSVSVIPSESGGMRVEPLIFDVIDKDISGITVKLVQGASISGVVVLENPNPAAFARFSELQMRVYVTGTSGVFPVGTSATAPVATNGSFLVGGLPGGLATITLGSTTNGVVPRGFRFVRVERDGVSTQRGIQIKDGEQLTGVRVVLTYGTAMVRGFVNFENGTLPPGGSISLWFMRLGEQPNTGWIPTVDARGRFLLEGIPAGAYDVRATVVSVPQLLPPRSAKREITIQDGATTDVVLTIDMNPPQKP